MRQLPKDPQLRYYYPNTVAEGYFFVALLEPLLLWNRIMERREKRAEG